MAKKAKSKEKKSLVCVTAYERGGNMRKRCSLLTQKEVKKLFSNFVGVGIFVKEINRF